MSRKINGDLPAYFALAAITTFVLLFVQQLPMSRLDVPYEFYGDAVDKLAQIHNVEETGWLFRNERLGYPFGYDRLDFPRFDSLNYAIMGPIAALTGQPGLAMNLYYLAGFYLIGFISFFCLRRLSMDVGPAIVSSLLFSFIPYHVGRSVGHLTNGAYFLVPLAVLVLVWLAQNRLDPDTPGARRRWMAALPIAILVPLQTPYNGVFFAFLCVVAGAIALANRPNWRAVFATFALMSCVAATFAIEQVPVLLHQSTRNADVISAERSPEEAELYSLRLNQVLLPDAAHRVDALAQAKREFDDTTNVPNFEFRNQYIGALGILGLLALLWVLARAVAGRSSNGNDGLESAVRIAALLAIAILLLAMSSGVGTLIAYFVTSKIRAYNRILPFFAFCCLLGTGWLLQIVMGRIRKMGVRNAVLAAVGAIALLDASPRTPFQKRASNIARFDLDRAYYADVERRLENGAAVFQIPAVWYPEHLPMNQMTDYEEFKPWLFTRSLKFSYGGARGRPGYAWGKAVEKMPAEQMLHQVHAFGFAAILIDTSALSNDEAGALTDRLTQALPQPALVSSDRRLWLFSLGDCCGGPVAQIDSAHAPKAIPYALGAPPLTFSKGALGTQYLISGWHEPEEWGTWSAGGHARLRMQLTPRPTNSLQLTLNMRALVGPTLTSRHLRVECRSKTLAEVDFSPDLSERKLQVDIPLELIDADGVFEVRFVVTPEDATPVSAGVGVDARALGIGLSELGVAQASQAPRAD
jgi:phosphoglycerol transferase